jgi:hypothetical protein
MSWWIPIDREAIMRFGHSVNTSIPEDPNEAEFPPEPWPNHVIIRIKSAPPPPTLPMPEPAGGDPSASGLSTSWTGPALGQAPAISPDAATLANYISPNQSFPTDGELDEDLALSILRGTLKMDEEVQRLVAWNTRKDYNTMVGIALPIKHWVGEDYHVIQFWEESMNRFRPWTIRQLTCTRGSSLGSMNELSPNSFLLACLTRSLIFRCVRIVVARLATSYTSH